MVAPRRFALIGHTHNLSDLVGDSDDIDEGTTNLFFTDERAQDAVGSILVDSTSIDFTYADGTPSITAVVLPAGVNHNALANLTVGDPHTQYQLEANLTEDVQDIVGAFLVDSATIDFTYNDAGNAINVAVIPGGVDHNALLNFVSNKHIDHTAVTLTAGAGLTGGGDISASRTFDIGAGTGITVNANDIQIAAAYQGANPSASVGLSAVNGSATSYMRSDGAPALSQAIIPTWTGLHTFNPSASEMMKLVGKDATGDAYIGIYRNNGTTRKSYLGFGNAADDTLFIMNEENDILTLGTNQLERFRITAAGDLQGNADNRKIQLGASQDISIYHDGTNSLITNTTGVLKITGESQFLTNRVLVSDTASPALVLDDTDSSSDEKRWGVRVSGNAFAISTATDAAGAGSYVSNALTISRIGTAVKVWTLVGTEFVMGMPITTKGYTVAGLPTGTLGMLAHVTDALTPTFGATAVGGGAVKLPVFYNGTNWVTI